MERVLDGLADLVDLLELDVLLDGEPVRLSTDAVALTPLPSVDGGPWRSTVATVTRGGLLVRLREPSLARSLAVSPRDGWNAEQAPFEGFDPEQDAVVGLYWTRNAHPFRRTMEVIAVVRRGRTFRAYQCPFDGVLPSAVPVVGVGEEVPEWMRVCPVSAPAGHDLFASPPSSALPPWATGAVYDRGRWIHAFSALADAQAGAIEGEAICPFGEQVAAATRNQTIQFRSTRTGEPGNRALTCTWQLRHEPTALCEVESVAGCRRLLVACDAGHMALGVVVGATTVKRRWDDLAAALDRHLGFHTMQEWCDWARLHVDDSRHSEDPAVRARLAAVLRILLERAFKEPGLEPELIGRVARVFRRPAAADAFAPTMRLVRRQIAGWKETGHHAGAELVWAVYEQLPFDIEDLFDLELREFADAEARTPVPPAPGGAPPRNFDGAADPDDGAFFTLVRDSLVNRKEVLETGNPLAKTILSAQAWTERFVLEFAERMADRRRGVMRGTPGVPWILLVRRDGLWRVSSDPTAPFDAITTREWFRPSRNVFVRKSTSTDGMSVVLASAEQIALLQVPDGAREAERVWSWKPVGCTVLRAADAGGHELFVIVETDSGQGELILLSATTGEVLASAPFGHTFVRELAVIPRPDGQSWILAHDEPEDSVAAANVRRNGATLEVGVRCRRRALGRVRSLAALPGTPADQPRLLVGSTEGYVVSLLAEASEPSLDVQWMYRGGGAIRHLAVGGTPEAPLVVALSALGEVFALDREGRRVWCRRFDAPLRSSAFFGGPLASGGIQSSFGIVDVDGNVRVYRETSSSSAKAAAFRHVAEIHPWDDSAEHDVVRSSAWDLAWTVRSLALADGSPSVIPATWDARSCLLRALTERAEEGSLGSSEATWLLSLCGEIGLRGLGDLARLRPAPQTRELRRRIAERLSLELRARRSVGAEADRELDEDAASLLAEMIRSVGADIVTSSTVQAAPTAVREDPWVLTSFLLRALPASGSSRSLARLLDVALPLGPASIGCIPLLVRREDAPAAEALARSVAAVTRAETIPMRANTSTLLDTVSGPACLLAGLLRLLHCEKPEWQELLAICDLRRRAGEAALLHPVLSHAMALVEQFAPCEHLYRRPVDEQRETLERLQASTLPAPGADTGDWRKWLEMLQRHLGVKLGNIIDARRRHLQRVTRARLDAPKVEYVRDRLVTIRTTIHGEGPEHGGAEATLTAAADSGVRPLDEALSLKVRLGDTPTELSWRAVPEENATSIWIEAETRAPSGATHTETWRLSLPPPRELTETPFDKLPLARAAIVKPLLALASGFHVVSIDESLGGPSIVNELLGAGGFRRVEVDRVMENRGPGRAESGGFHTQSLLEVLGAVSRRDGSWNIPRAADGVIAYPAAETTSRLVSHGLRHVVNELRDALRRLSGRPVLWLAPPHEAGELAAALQGSATYHNLNRVPLGDPELLAELVAWLADRPVLAEAAAHTLGGDLRLLQLWKADSENRPGRASQLVAESADARAVLEADLAGLGPHERADLVVSARSQTQLPVRSLVEGLVAAEPFQSTSRIRAPKTLIAVGDRLRIQQIRALFADHRPRTFFRVHGYWPGASSTTLVKEVEPLALAVHRDLARERESYQRLASRGIVLVSAETATLAAPYAQWVEGELERDPTGRAFAEGAGGRPLFEILSFAELAGAGERLAVLLPDVDRRALRLIRGLGELDRSAAPEAKLLDVGRQLTGVAVEPVEAGAASDLARDLRLELGQALQVCRIQRSGESYSHYIAYLRAPPRVQVQRCDEIIKRAGNAVVTFFGPGISETTFKESKEVCALSERSLKEIVLSADPTVAFWQHIKRRVGLLPFSPFQTGNQLPEDSPVFVGREEETERILASIDKNSFLIVGGRQIGKTSLLRHAYGQARKNELSRAIWLDVASMKTATEVLPCLCDELRIERRAISGEEAAISEIEAILRAQRSPVLFINEFDGICASCPGLLARLRALSEIGACQCVIVGYHQTYLSAKTKDSALFHWTHGRVGEKAFILGALSEPAAQQLVAKLEGEPLRLDWESRETQGHAIRVLFERSHGIPLLLQQACQKIVVQLNSERSARITRAHVDAALGSALVWTFIQSIRFVGEKETMHEKLWADLVLGAVVAMRYFRPEPPPIRGAGLRQTTPEKFGFTTMDALREVQAYVRREASGKEAERFERTFSPEAYDMLFDGLTLTVLLAPATTADRAYYFQGHIFPIELGAYLERERQSMDDYMFQKLVDINDLLAREV